MAIWTGVHIPAFQYKVAEQPDRMGFRNGRFGYASALAWVLVVIAAVVIVIIFRSSERWVYYETEGEGE